MLIYLYLALITLYKDFKNKLNILFSLSCLGMVIWTFFLGVAYSQKSSTLIHLLIRVGYIGKFVFFPLNLHFYLVLTKTKIKSWLLILCYLPTVILNIVNLIGYSILSDVVIMEDGFRALIGFDWIFLYMVSIWLCYSISAYAIYRWGKHLKIKKQRMYSRVILMILSFSYSTAFLTTIILPLLGFYNLQPIGLTLFYLYIIGMFFLVSKYRLLNINFSLMADEIISNINDIVIVLDPDLKILEVNGKFDEVFSTTPKKIKNKLFLDLITGDEDCLREFKELSENGKKSFKMRISYSADEENLITNTYVSAIKDRFGDLIGFLVISGEIKEIRQFQKYFRITNRELEIVECSIRGLTNKEVSQKLSIAERTVEAHLNNIYNKLKINNKVELGMIAADFIILPKKQIG